MKQKTFSAHGSEEEKKSGTFGGSSGKKRATDAKNRYRVLHAKQPKLWKHNGEWDSMLPTIWGKSFAGVQRTHKPKCGKSVVRSKWVGSKKSFHSIWNYTHTHKHVHLHTPCALSYSGCILCANNMLWHVTLAGKIVWRISVRFFFVVTFFGNHERKIELDFGKFVIKIQMIFENPS